MRAGGGDHDARESTLVADGDDAGLRLDQFLARQLPALSRSQIQRLIRQGQVRISGDDHDTPGAGAKPAKPSLEVHAGLIAHVVVPAPAAATPGAEDLPLTIIHDDRDVVVIDKPAGLVVHPAAGHATGTLVNALLYHVRGLSGIGGEIRPGIVHRLDKGTSGVMVIAKTDAAHRALARQFHDRDVGKEYVALVWGAVHAGRTIDQPIGRDRRHRTKMSARSDSGRTALTTITHAEPFRGVTLVRVAIGTGRTHQIRVHLSEIGHPVVGDALYGGVKRRLAGDLAPLGQLDRPFLHAARLTFTHPATGGRVTFESALPVALQQVIDHLPRPRG